MEAPEREDDDVALRAVGLETARSILVLRRRAAKQLIAAKQALETKTTELAEANRKLQGTLDELHRTHWHLRKIAEVLPMCAECGRVKPGDGEWASVVDYLRENSLFLSHGCCPECA
ncbi:MAG: hypothetical protein LC754_05225, partial [Acidobacteria bacterium]|nr:hypothetical protein [Acidobacteriota bacterium]